MPAETLIDGRRRDSIGRMGGGRARGAVVLVAALVVDAVGNGLFAPLSLVYFARLTDVPFALIGVLLTVANVIPLPVPLWAGAWADRIGPLPLVVAAQALQALGFVGYASVRGPVGILVAATLVAVGVRVFWCVIFTLVADLADAGVGSRGVDGWYAVAGAARTAGLAVGGLLTGVVVADGRPVAYRLVAYGAAACLALAGGLLAAGVRAPRMAGPQRGSGRPATTGSGPACPAGYRDLVRDRPFLGLVVLNTVFAGTSMMLAFALPTVVAIGGAGPVWLTSVLLAANAALITIASAPIVHRLRRFRRTRGIAAAAVLWALWCAVLALTGMTGPPLATVLLVAGTLLFTVAEAVHAPLSTAVAADTAPPAARGRYLSTFQYSFALASAVVPAFFTGLYAVGHAVPFVVLGIVEVLAALGLLRLERALPTAAVGPPVTEPR